MFSILGHTTELGDDITRYLINFTEKFKDNPYSMINETINLGTKLFDGTII